MTFFIGTIYLLLLKRYAYYLLLYAYIISWILLGYDIFSKDNLLLEKYYNPGILTIGFIIMGAIILYAKGLIKKRILK